MKLRLPDSIASIQDLKSLTDEVRDFSQWYNHEETKKQAGVKKTSERPTLSQGASQLIRDYSAKKAISPTSLAELIKELEIYAKDAPTISFILAAPAPGSVKNNLVNWARKNIAPDILVNFQFNSSILGGMVVRYGSRIFDWSFRRQILMNKNNFTKALDNVR